MRALAFLALLLAGPACAEVIGYGSGVIVSERGMVMTAKHVVEDCGRVTVEVPGRARYAVEGELLFSRDDGRIMLVGYIGPYAAVREIGGGMPDFLVAAGYVGDGARRELRITRGIGSKTQVTDVPDGHFAHLAHIALIDVEPGMSGGPVFTPGGVLAGLVVGYVPAAGHVPKRGLVLRGAAAISVRFERIWSRVRIADLDEKVVRSDAELERMIREVTVVVVCHDDPIDLGTPVPLPNWKPEPGYVDYIKELRDLRARYARPPGAVDGANNAPVRPEDIDIGTPVEIRR